MEQQQTTAPAGTDQKPDLMKHAARFGAIIAGVGIVLTLLIYAVDYTIMASMWFGLIMIVFSIGFVIYAGINYRNQSGGFLPYKKAFQHGYITLIVAGLISTLFNIILYSVIDPDLAQNITDAIVANTESMMRSFGAPEDSIDQQLDKMRAEMPARFSTMGMLKQMGWNLIIYAVISAITSLFVKKNEPELM